MSARATLALVAAAIAVACGGRSPRPGAPEEVTPPRPFEALPPTCAPRAPGTPQQVVQRAHNGAVTDLAFSPDGRYLASAGEDHTARIWDTRRGKLVRVIRAPEGAASDMGFATVAWSPDATELVYGYGSTRRYGVRDGAARGAVSWETTALNGRLYDVDVRNVQPITGHGGARWIGRASLLTVFDADFQRLAALSAPQGASPLLDECVPDPGGTVCVGAYDDQVAVWDLRAAGYPARLLTLPTAVRSITPLPGGGEAVIVHGAMGEDRAEIVDLDDGETRTPLASVDDLHTIWHVAARGDAIAFASARGVYLIGRDGALRWRFAHPEYWDFNRYRRVAISADGRHVAAARPTGEVMLLDAATGRLLGVLGAELRRAWAIDFYDDDNLVVGSGSHDFRPYFGRRHLSVWSVATATKREAASFERPDLVAFGRVGDDLVTLRSMRMVENTAFDDCPVGRASIHADRWRGLSPPAKLPSDEELDVDVAEPSADEPLAWPPRDAVAACYAADGLVDADLASGRAVVYDARTEAYQIVDLTTGAVVPLDLGEYEYVFPKQFSSDGRFFLGASGLGAGRAIVWDARTGAQLHRFGVRVPNGEAAHGGAASATRVAVFYGERVEIRRWDALDERTPVTVPAMTTALGFAGDRTVIGADDGSLTVVEDDRVAGRGASDGGAILEIAVNPSGTRIATISEDGSIRVWDARAPRVLYRLIEFVDDEWIAATPDGHYTGTAEAARRIGWVFDPLDYYDFEQFAAVYDDAEVVAARARGRSAGAGESATRAGRPPCAELAAAPIVDGDRAYLRVRGAASAGAVAELRVYADGRLVARREGDGSAELVGDVAFPLAPGTNRVSVYAFDEAGLASNAHTVDLEGPAAGARPALWITTIGVSRYRRLDARWQLPAADDDAREVAAAMARLAGEGEPYRRTEPRVIVDGDVTPASVTDALSALSAMAPGDLAIVYVAGHGWKRGADGEMVFLTGDAAMEDLEASAIAWRDIAAALERAKGRVIVFLDACHSGHVSRELVVPNAELAARLSRTGRAGVFVFAASKGRQLSYETTASRGLRWDDAADMEETDEGDGNGLFARAIVVALGDPASDANGDGVVFLSELVAAVTRRVVDVSEAAQTPWVVRREIFGDIPIARAARESGRSAER